MYILNIYMYIIYIYISVHLSIYLIIIAIIVSLQWRGMFAFKCQFLSETSTFT